MENTAQQRKRERQYPPLDTDAKEALEMALSEFDGGIITVSHDRYFLDKVCDTIWDLQGDGSIVVWPGNYSEYKSRSISSPKNR